jgi:hypothetical protein
VSIFTKKLFFAKTQKVLSKEVVNFGKEKVEKSRQTKVLHNSKILSFKKNQLFKVGAQTRLKPWSREAPKTKMKK